MNLPANPDESGVAGRIAATPISRRDWLVGAAAAAAGAILAPDPARALLRAGTPDRLDVATRFFDLLALLDQEDNGGGATPGWVRKWVRPVRVRLRGSASTRFAAELENALAPLSRWTGLPFRRGPEYGPNEITIEVKSGQAQIEQIGAGGQVCTCATFGWGGRLHTGHIEISARHADCLRHELMHAIGFDNHWAGVGGPRSADGRVRSALARRHSPHRADGFTRWDELAIRTLYDPRLEPRMPRARALPIAREILSSLINS
ncbi:MAG: hypothetical protein ACTSXZ_09960 [Alphaproteobacteria bacterium]